MHGGYRRDRFGNIVQNRGPNNYHHMPLNPGCLCEECQNTFAGHNYQQRCSCKGCDAQRTKAVAVTQGREMHVSTINFCDRCESMGKSEAMGTIEIQPSVNHNAEKAEYCPGCIQDFMDWKTSDVMTTRERAYKEPWTEQEREEPAGEVLFTKQQVKELIREIESGN